MVDNDPSIKQMLDDNVKEATRLFEIGLQAMLEGRITPQESVSVVLHEPITTDDPMEIARVYLESEHREQTPIQFTRLAVSQNYTFWTIIYRERRNPSAVGYGLLGEGMSVCEKMGAKDLITYLQPSELPYHKRMEHFTLSAPVVMSKLIEIGRFRQ